MKSLLLTPDDEQFWNKTELFIELKLQAVEDESYENSKFLYKTLKMRNLGDLNDLYNTQDVILLCKNLESRFQVKCQKSSLHFQQKLNLSKFLNKQLLVVLVALISWLLTPNYYYPTL